MHIPRAGRAGKEGGVKGKGDSEAVTETETGEKEGESESRRERRRERQKVDNWRRGEEFHVPDGFLGTLACSPLVVQLGIALPKLGVELNHLTSERLCFVLQLPHLLLANKMIIYKGNVTLPARLGTVPQHQRTQSPRKGKKNKFCFSVGGERSRNLHRRFITT